MANGKSGVTHPLHNSFVIWHNAPMKKLTATLGLIIAVLVGFTLGLFVLNAGHQGVDGEYFRALKAVDGSGINWIDAIFRYCVVLLVQMAKIFGISYEALNIWVFIIVQPLVIILLSIWVFRLRRMLRRTR